MPFACEQEPAPQTPPRSRTPLYVNDADGVANQAVAAGAKLLRPVADQFYGDRSGTLKDPFEHVWHVATHKKDLSLQEMKKRCQATFSEAERGGARWPAIND